MDENRLGLYQFLLDEGRLPSSIKNYSDFKRGYFDKESTVERFWNFLTSTKQKVRKKEYYYKKPLPEFYKSYCCDLEWAKSTTYCGGSSDVNWDSCVNSLTPKKVVGDTIVYKSSDSNYGVVTLKKDHTFTSTGPKYTKGKWSCTSEGKVYIEHTDEVTPGPNPPGPNPNPSPSACVATTATGADIISGTLIKRCVKGDIVKEIQKHLKKHGFPNFSKDGTIDGVYGGRTKQMVIDFQTSKGLKPDGIVGPKTWVELVKDKSSSPVTPITPITPVTPVTPVNNGPISSGKDVIQIDDL